MCLLHPNDLKSEFSTQKESGIKNFPTLFFSILHSMLKSPGTFKGSVKGVYFRMKKTEMKKRMVFSTTVILLFLFIPLICCADTAEVLPKGIFYFDTTYYHYFNIIKRYNPDGNTEPLAIDLNTDLNSSVFPDLTLLDPLVGGSASIGRSDVDFSLLIKNFEFSLYYGITDKLSFGVMVPYYFLKNKVNARLDSSTANVGKSSLLNSLAPLSGPFAPPDVEPLIADDVQNLIGKGLDINGDGITDIEGFNFKRVETWSDRGLGDIEITGKYQFFKNSNWRLACVGGVRLPTGEVDDPDNLADIAFGDGQTDLLFRLHADYLGIKNLLLNATMRYDIQLPDHELLRVPVDVNLPLTANKETVKRNLGDAIELELMGSYEFTKQLSGGLKYRYTKRFKDDIENNGRDIISLEEETNPTGQMFFITLGYSTVQMYLEKKFAVPFSVNLSYRNRFAGTNNLNKSQYISLDLTVFF